MTEILKHCPCCGGVPAIWGVVTDKGHVWELRLGSQWDKDTPSEFATREEAHEAWNRMVGNG